MKHDQYFQNQVTLMRTPTNSNCLACYCCCCPMAQFAPVGRWHWWNRR